MVGRDLSIRRHELARIEGDARSTASVGFSGGILTWADLPAQSRKAAQHRGKVVAEQVGAAGIEETPHGLVQLLYGWRAHQDRVYVVVAERPMLVGRGGPRASGPWRHVSVVQHDVQGEARRRIGWVPAGLSDVRRPHAPGAVGRDSVAMASRPEHLAAATAWTHLPATVREPAEQAVPLPVDWLGQISQVTGDGGVGLSQSVTVLRRDEHRALVISATRERTPTPGFSPADQNDSLARTDWLVEQVTLDLRTPRLLPPATPRVRLPWS